VATLPKRGSNLLLTTACVAVVVVSFSNTHNAFRIIHPQCNALRLQPVLHPRCFLHNTPTMRRASSSICSVRFPCRVTSVATFAKIMVEHIIQVTSEYEERLRRCEYVPRFSCGGRMLKNDGDPNRFFLMYLFREQSLAIQFLKDIGLLRSKVQCNTCGRDMKWSVDSTHSEGFRWRCQRRVAGVKCNQSASIKVGTWFQ